MSNRTEKATDYHMDVFNPDNSAPQAPEISPEEARRQAELDIMYKYCKITFSAIGTSFTFLTNSQKQTVRAKINSLGFGTLPSWQERANSFFNEAKKSDVGKYMIGCTINQMCKHLVEVTEFMVDLSFQNTPVLARELGLLEKYEDPDADRREGFPDNGSSEEDCGGESVSGSQSLSRDASEEGAGTTPSQEEESIENLYRYVRTLVADIEAATSILGAADQEAVKNKCLSLSRLIAHPGSFAHPGNFQDLADSLVFVASCTIVGH